MAITTLLFDADDTLFDYARAERYALSRLFARLGVTGEENYALYNAINDALWRQLERGQVDFATLRLRRFEQLAERLGLCIEPRRASSIYLDALGEACFPTPDALAVLQTLSRRVKIGIVTNGITQVQKRRLNYSGFSRYISALTISEAEGVAKPNPRLVAIALERLGCPSPEQAVLVGDSLTSDAPAARAAGVRFLWYNPSGRQAPGGASYETLARLTQLMDYFHDSNT